MLGSGLVVTSRLAWWTWWTCRCLSGMGLRVGSGVQQAWQGGMDLAGLRKGRACRVLLLFWAQGKVTGLMVCREMGLLFVVCLQVLLVLLSAALPSASRLAFWSWVVACFERWLGEVGVGWVRQVRESCGSLAGMDRRPAFCLCVSALPVCCCLSGTWAWTCMLLASGSAAVEGWCVGRFACSLCLLWARRIRGSQVLASLFLTAATSPSPRSAVVRSPGHAWSPGRPLRLHSGLPAGLLVPCAPDCELLDGADC